MSTSDTPQAAEEKPDSNEVVTPPQPAEEQPGKPPRSGSAVALSALLMSLLVALGTAGGGWWLYQQLEQDRAQQAPVEQRQPQYEQALQDLRGRIQTLETTLGETRRLVEREKDATLSSLTQLNQRLQTLSTTSREDWLLAEAEYLLRLANQRLLTEGSNPGISALLSAADTILKENSDPRLYPVREALAVEMAALAQTRDLDREGIYARLVAAQQAVLALDIATHSAIVPAEHNGTQPVAGWRGFLQRLQDLVRISETGTETQTLRPAYQLLARAQMSAAISQAQAALLREEGQLFQEALRQAHNLLNTHFLASPQQQWLQGELQALAQLDIAPQRPDIGVALERLQGYMDQHHKVKAESPAAAGGDE